MAKNAWVVGAQKISSLMRKDVVEIFKSVPVRNSIAELSDNLVSLGECSANVTTPPETIDEDISGTLRTHFYEITLDPDVSLPLDCKLFVKLVKVRQGVQGSIVEVTGMQGGLLGQTLSASDERN